jgi:hypothetical protein
MHFRPKRSAIAVTEQCPRHWQQRECGLLLGASYSVYSAVHEEQRVGVLEISSQTFTKHETS